MTTQTVAREEIKIGEGISTAVLLLMVLLSVAGSIHAADWADGLGVLAWAAVAGAGFGFALAKLPVRGFLAHLAMLIFAAPATATAASALLPNALTFSEKMIVLEERFIAWTRKVIAGGTSADNLIFVMQLTILMWVLAYSAAWFVYRRHQVWGALVPTGAALLLNLFYAAPQSGLYLGIFTVSALMLIVRLNLTMMERAWRNQAIGYATDINFDFLTYGIAFSLLLIMLVWLLPAAAPGPAWLGILEPFQGEWQGIEEQFSRVFSAVRGAARPAPSTFFGTTLSLGGPVRLGQRTVMDVQTNYGRYWRAAIYDKYTGIGWINTRLDTLNLSANDEILNASRGALRADVTQTVKVYLPDQNMLFAAAQPIRFGVPTEIRYGQSAAGPPDPALMDLALVRSRKMIREGDTYTVVSAISVADEDALRHDSLEYSRWISATYLQLPDDLPVRVRALAQQITEKSSNPYDRAAAIEKYLRENIKYNELISAPPPGRDGVDYTLFDRPEGYCNYYASAMVVLARALGIPARIATGYAFGEYKDGAFHVVETNAHSWPELYFPTYGWIEFEPTASQPIIERPKKTEPGSEPAPEFDPNLLSRQRSRQELEDDMNLGSGGTGSLRPRLPSPRDLAIIAVGIFALIGLGAAITELVRRARRLARLAPAARVYEAMLIRARWLGIREQKYATAFERAQRLGTVLPNARRDAERVAALYTHERYGARPLDPVERASLSIAWDTIRAEWRRGFVAYLIERVTASPRRLLARLARFNSRFSSG